MSPPPPPPFLTFDAGPYQVTYAVLSHVAIAAHMMVLKEYGGVTAVLVGTARKAMTISLSFLIFPKVGLFV